MEKTKTSKLYRNLRKKSYLQLRDHLIGKFLFNVDKNYNDENNEYLIFFDKLHKDINLFKKTLNEYLSDEDVKKDKELNKEINILIENLDHNKTCVIDLSTFFKQDRKVKHYR